MVVPKYKRSGVERNRLKRRLRELVRTRLLPAIPAADVVIRPWPNAYDASFDVLAREIESARGRLVKAFPAEREAAPAASPRRSSAERSDAPGDPNGDTSEAG